MTRDTPSNGTPKAPSTRDDRLKAALKANLRKRKAQAEARKQKNKDEKAG